MLEDVAAREGERFWPPVLGLYTSMVVALAYLRGNRIQAELGETFGVPGPTISRAVAWVTPRLGQVLEEFVPTAEDLDEEVVYVVEATLLACWSWAWYPGLFSGKHETTGMNVQVACTLDGRLAWIPDPVPGARHDSYCLNASGVLDTLDPGSWIGDKGYVGNDMLTPAKKTRERELHEGQKHFNTQVNKIR
jgi:hypothetical protein